MTLDDLIKLFRERADDEAEPFLWKQEKVIHFINEAEREAAERARLIYDETSPLTTLAVKQGVPQYPLNRLIIGIDRVFSTEQGRTLRRTTREELDAGNCRWESDVSDPRYFFERERYLRLYPTPSTDQTMRLSLWRRPIRLMEDKCDEPEIPEQHHKRLIDWALHRAFDRRDADEEDLARSARHLAIFEASFGFRQDANVQRKHRLHRVPTVKAQW